MVHFARGMKQTTIINSNDSRQSVCFYINYVYSTFLHMYTQYIYPSSHIHDTDRPNKRICKTTPYLKKYAPLTKPSILKSHMKTLIYREFSSPCEAMKNCGLYSWKKLITVSTKIPNTSRKCSKDDSILNYMHATCIFSWQLYMSKRMFLYVSDTI